MTENLTELRNKVIRRRYKNLNEPQFKAATHTEGPLLILAGAGSGKTTVLVNRIAYLLEFGSAYDSDVFIIEPDAETVGLMKRYIDGDDGVFPLLSARLRVDPPRPWEILAITFTNKAVNELKDRIIARLGEEGGDIWASTFHSACVRILRRWADRIGYSSHFTIYDTDDSKRVIKECQKLLSIDEKLLPAKVCLAEISSAKNKLLTADAYLNKYQNDARRALLGAVYKKYSELVRSADAMDFDDIINNTVTLLQKNSDVLEHYARQFRYVMVDEYQDTNLSQYMLTALLASGSGNLCVVGDDDQSIYKFRGATIENILKFETNFPGAEVIKLERNYRSTGNILDAANGVIANNSERKGKTLITANPRGDKVTLCECDSDFDEAEYIADKIVELSANRQMSDFAVLYRMNAQSNLIERALVKRAIAYRIIGGHKFYDRKEIKDMTAYLAVACNPADNVRLRRIINEPKRGIGEATLNNAQKIADALSLPLFEIIRNAQDYPVLARAASKLTSFADMIIGINKRKDDITANALFNLILEKTHYIEYLAEDKATFEDRSENINQLAANSSLFEQENPDDPSIDSFLEEVALMTDIDNYNSDADAVVLMTLHSAKGLEFPVVFIPGMENGIFPGVQSLMSRSELEEERRLCYVGITRAKEKLFIVRARSRQMFGQTMRNPPSVFLDEIPPEVTEDEERSDPWSFYGRGFTSAYTGTVRSGQEFGVRSPEHKGSRLLNNTQNSKPGTQNSPQATGLTEFSVGQRVRHKKFGEGTVLSFGAMGNDVLVEVAFDEYGTKKLMAKFAGLKDAADS